MAGSLVTTNAESGDNAFTIDSGTSVEIDTLIVSGNIDSTQTGIRQGEIGLKFDGSPVGCNGFIKSPETA